MMAGMAADLTDLAESRTRVRVTLPPSNDSTEGIIVAHGEDLARGGWVMIRTDDGDIEVRERLTLRIDTLDADAADGGAPLGMEP